MKPTRSQDLEAVLARFRPDPRSRHTAAAQQAVWLARFLQERAQQLQTRSERRQQRQLDHMLRTPSDKVTLALMTDQAFRARAPRRAVEHLAFILDAHGVHIQVESQRGRGSTFRLTFPPPPDARQKKGAV